MGGAELGICLRDSPRPVRIIIPISCFDLAGCYEHLSGVEGAFCEAFGMEAWIPLGRLANADDVQDG